MVRIAILASLLAAPASADNGPPRIAVTVGETVEVNVGYAVGFRCDDLKLISAGMVTRDGTNVFVVKGLAAGKTLCRVGNETQASPSVLYEIVVTEKAADKPRRR
jgi:hypothetical protein